jgi:Phosphate-selective porin O and P
MTLTKYVGILASGLALTGAASAQGTDAMSEIAQLKAEVATLKSQNGDKWLTEERAAEIKSLVKDVLADSETRTSLQGSGATSGYNNGFFISSADGNFKLNLSLLAQARFTWNYQPGENIGTGADESISGTGDGVSTWAFENRRTQMAFSGNVVDPSWTYMARMNYGSASDPYTPTSGTPGDDYQAGVVLQDAWVNKDFGNGFGVKVGQFKSPFMAESLRNDGAQLTAERSVVDYTFSGGYTQGIMLNYTQDMFRAMGSYNNGPRAQNGTWSTGSNNSISLAGRAEFKAMGSWSQFDNESSLKSDESGLVIGAAIQYYNNRGAASAATGAQYNPSVGSPIYGSTGGITTTGAVDWTADVTFKSAGLSLSAAFVGATYSGDFLGTASNQESSSYALVVQGGYRFTDSLEAFGRWEWLNVENGAANDGGLQSSATDVNNILTFGVNVYAGTNMKWTTQFGISLSDIGNSAGNFDLGGAGWNTDANTSNSDQMNVISQLQIMF